MSKYKLGPIFKHDFPVTQRYGENPESYPMFAVPGHEGTDYGTPNGTEIISPFDGIILRDTLFDKDYGNFLVVWDSIQRCAVWFCHLADTPPGPGDKVTKGQVVAHSNNTGHSTGPHTHVNFVETDASGNRLNMNNGKQGFLDLLDTDLVEFTNSAIITQEIAQQPQITPQTQLPMFNNQEQQAVKSQFDDKDKKITENTETIERLTAALDKAIKAAQSLHDVVKENIDVTSTTYPASLEMPSETVKEPKAVDWAPVTYSIVNFFKNLFKAK